MIKRGLEKASTSLFSIQKGIIFAVQTGWKDILTSLLPFRRGFFRLTQCVAHDGLSLHSVTKSICNRQVE